MKRIFAIDPGPSVSAWVEYSSGGGDRPGQIHAYGNLPNADLEARIGHSLKGDETRVVCEDVSSAGTAGAETFDTAKEIGRLSVWAQCAGVQFDTITRVTVKMYLLGGAVGKDPEVRAELCRYFGVAPDAKKSEMGMLKGFSTHLWAALAVAVAFDMRECAKARKEQAAR